jgi:hypothetical protein
MAVHIETDRSAAPLATHPDTGQPPGIACAVEAMRCFSGYHVPEIKDFLKRIERSRTGRKAVLLERIRDFLLSDTLAPDPVACRAAFDFIDEQKEYGEQHVFLFHLPRDQTAYLRDLSDAAVLRRSPEAAAVLDTHGGDLLVLMPAEPTLAGVIRRSEPTEELVLKWVDTRLWWQQRKLGQHRFARERHSERAVSFFRVDLETGDAELKLQSLRPNAELSLYEELRRLEERVRRIVDLGRFEPVLVEPVLHGLLLDPGRARVQEWRVDWAEGGRLEGTAEPSFVQSLPLRFGHFFAERAGVDWPVTASDGTRYFRVNFDGRLDAFEIPNACRRAELDQISRSIRRRGRRTIETAEVRRAARGRSGLRAAFEKIDQHVHGLGERELRLDEVAQESRVSADEMERASELLAEKYPEVFHLRYRIRCPDAGKPERGDGPATRWYETREAIPKRVQCTYAKDGTRWHAARENVEAVLEFDPDLKGPQLALRLHRVAVEKGITDREADGSALTPGRIGGALLLLFTAPLAVALLVLVGSLFPEAWVGDVVLEAVKIVLTLLGLGFIGKGAVEVVGEPAEELLRTLLIRIAERLTP